MRNVSGFSSLASVISSGYLVSSLNTNDAMALNQVEMGFHKETEPFSFSQIIMGAPAKHARGKLYH